jgi:hypothetical protein
LIVAYDHPTPIRKAVIHLPDATGAHLMRDYREMFEPALTYAPIVTAALAELPSVTPVCFASIFTSRHPPLATASRFVRRSSR